MTMLAVITGDLVGSSQLTSAKLQQVLNRLEQELTLYCLTPEDSYQIFRGDSFQLTLSNPSRAPLIALRLRWLLIALSESGQEVDARLAIAVAQIPLNYDSKYLNTEAHLLSGRGLDSLKNQRIKWFCSNELFCIKSELLTRFADNRISTLTATQANALFQFSADSTMTHQTLANQLGSSRVNATRLLNSADYNLLLDYGKLMSQWIAEL